MDPAIKQGFAIGLVAAVVAGYVGWRQGWWPSPAVTAKLESVAPDALKPAEPEAPAAKSMPAAPAPKAETQPGAAAKPPAPGGVAALPTPSARDGAPPSRASVEKGAFDVVRVEPSGEAVVAGRCAANCVVELTANGKTHDKVTADAGGNWAMTPPQLAPGDYQLGLKVTTPDGKSATSEQSVTVSVPKTPNGEVVVVLNEPNAPSKVLQRPGEAQAAAKPPAETARVPGAPSSAPPPRPDGAVSIGAIDAEKGRLFVQGTAAAGAALRVYLNNALIAQPVAGRDARWSVRVERGLTPGDYAARVDHVDKPSGKVIARAEARFVYEGEVAEGAAPSGRKPQTQAPTASAAPSQQSGGPAEGKTTTFAAASGATGNMADAAPQGVVVDAPASPDPSADASIGGSPTSDAANPVVATIDTMNVRRGDSLWRISRKTYGSGTRYTVIFTANDKQIRDPALIYPGQVLVLPEDPAKAASREAAPAR